jgi:hypothetical protein
MVYRRGGAKVYQLAEYRGSGMVCAASAGAGLRCGVVLPTCPAAFRTIAVAVQLEDVHMVNEPIEQGSGEPLGAEPAGPLIERQIAGQITEPRYSVD